MPFMHDTSRSRNDWDMSKMQIWVPAEKAWIYTCGLGLYRHFYINSHRLTGDCGSLSLRKWMNTTTKCGLDLAAELSKASICLYVQGIKIPSFKNSKMLTRGRLITNPKNQKIMELIVQSFESQLNSHFQTSVDVTSTELCPRSWIASSVPVDDSCHDIPEIKVTWKEVTKGNEGAIVIIEKMWNAPKVTSNFVTVEKRRFSGHREDGFAEIVTQLNKEKEIELRREKIINMRLVSIITRCICQKEEWLNERTYGTS